MSPPSYSTCIFSCCWACVGRGHPAWLWELIWGLGTLSLAAGLFPSPPPTPEPAGWRAVTVSQDNCLSSGSHVVTVGNYDLFHRESTINLGKGREEIREIRITNTLEGIWLIGFLTRRQKRECFVGRNIHINVESLDRTIYFLPSLTDKKFLSFWNLTSSRKLSRFLARQDDLVFWTLPPPTPIYPSPEAHTIPTLPGSSWWAHAICSAGL